MANDKKHVHIEKHKYYKFILYLMVIVLINIVGISLFFRVDLTSNGLYSLSDASIKAVSTLEEPLTINVFFSKNLPSPYNNVELYLHDLLEEYEVHANRNLSFRFYNVTAEEGDVTEEAEGNRKIAHSYGVYPVNVQKIEQDESKVQRAYMGMALIHGDVIEKIPALTSTEGLEYKITSAIRKMNNKISALVSLPEKIKVNLVLSSSISQIAPLLKLKGLQNLKSTVQEVVEKLQGKNYDQLQYAHINPTMGEGKPEVMKGFDRFKLQWPQVNNPNGGVIPAGNGMVALGLSYGGKTIEKNLLSRKMALSDRGLEEQYAISDAKEIETFINDNIDNLIDINEDLGYLSTHGTQPLSVDVPPQMRMMQQQMPESLEKFNALVSKEYSVKKVSLGEEDIPDSIDTLIIAGAKQNFTDWELFQIDQFLMKGKSLAIFMDAFNEIQQKNQYQQRGFQQPVYLPLNTGLEKLLSHYGMGVKKSYLLDENCYVQRDRSGNEMPIYFAPIIKNEKINHGLKFMENIKQMVAIKTSPVEADMEKIKKNDLKLEELFASSDKSWEMSGKINLMPFMIHPPKEEKEKASKPLAYLLEGKFNSYFADKLLPQRPEKKVDEPKTDAEGKEEKKEEKKPVFRETRVSGEKDMINKGTPGKIFLIGTSEVLKNNVLDDEARGPNSVFVLNLMDYLNNREGTAVMRGKTQRFNPLDDSKPATRTVVKLINIAGLPNFFIIFGIFVWMRRRARKKRIRAMFIKGQNNRQ
ncbi:MAG: hypothetical protein GY765_26545 [bacterium]|nr:hypothetical protein [bacterium]